MSDDFGTVSVKQKGREIELLRQHYLRHRDAIRELVADAPTEHLSIEYQRLVTDIDAALTKIAEIEGRPGLAVPPAAPPPHPARRGAAGDLLHSRTQPGTVPLDTYDPDATQVDYAAAADDNPRSRVALIVVAGALVLAVIGWMIWRASSNRRDDAATPVVEAPITETTTAPASTETTPATETASLAASPRSADYGTIRKGTRAVRQFDVTNNSDEPVSIQIARSTCRCLYYDHGEVVPPRGKETITVTVDGARAKSGTLHETVKVSSKKDPSIATSFDVDARIQ